ncbi:unnamed protein product [Durusdinium trenchii]|uniref:Uncharacterized protein n=1 Tax=Durusdinium trenchii TaxID=1381693 RepID=A0ABP0LHJ9_9DINO
MGCQSSVAAQGGGHCWGESTSASTWAQLSKAKPTPMVAKLDDLSIVPPRALGTLDTELGEELPGSTYLDSDESDGDGSEEEEEGDIRSAAEERRIQRRSFHSMEVFEVEDLEHLSPVRTTHALYVVELEEFLREVDEERLDAAVCYKRAVHAHKQKRREAKLAKSSQPRGVRSIVAV